MKRNIMIATVSNGNKHAFQEAKDEGDVWTDPEDETLYQYSLKTKKNTDSRSSKKVATEVWNVKGNKNFMGSVAHMIED
eukprot:6554230-Pyramimonas_sp.AAC.1